MAGHYRRACDLRHTVTIQQESRVADGGGGYALTWTKVADARAAIEPLTGGERLRAMQLEDKVSHRVTIRYRGDVTAGMRLKFGTRLFNIRAVINPDERNCWLELMCDEGVAT